MGVIQCGSLVSKIQGRVGTVIYYMHGKTQCVKGLQTQSTDPNSGPQQVVRALVSALSKAWADGTISAANKILWNIYAKRSRQEPHLTGGVLNPRLKPDNILAGINAFVWTNVMLVRCGLSQIITPPLLNAARPALLQHQTLTWNGTTLSIPWASPGSYANTQVLSHISTSKSIFHPQNTPSVVGTVGVIAVTNLSSIGGVSVPIVPTLPITIHSTLRYVMADGFISAISNTVSLALV